MTAEEELRALVDRVWVARREFYKVGIRLETQDVKIVVDNYYWAALLSWGRRLDLPVEIEVSVAEGATGVRLWGIPVEVDDCLDVREVRFRAEAIIP